MNKDTFGLSQTTLTFIKKVFSRYPQIIKVRIYGSRAKGNYTHGSDIDMTIIDDGTLRHEDFLEIIGTFEESNLPYMCDISLFRDLQNVDLIEHINRVGKTIYEHL